MATIKSIEEKAKAYDEAYKRVAVRFGSNVADEIFPELKESEDERIRKAIHIYLDWLDGRKDYAPKGEYSIREMIAWLEAQGEHTKFRDFIQVGDKVTRNQDGVLVNLSQLERVAKPAENKGEHDMGISKATKKKLEDNLNKALEKETPESWNEFLDEQKPTEEYNITGIGSKHAEGKMGEMIKKLKPVNEVLEQKPAWSEEDEEIHRKCICAMRASACGFPEEEKFVEQVDNWLKSLRHRNAWKPSDMQIDAVKDAIDYLGCNTKKVREYLMSLHEQLKKLKG